MEDDQGVREKKIIAILNEEVQDGEDLAAEARRQIEYLLLEKKGYAPEEVRKQMVFDVTLDKRAVHVVRRFSGRGGRQKGIVIKCSAGSLSSRERQAVAAARLLGAPWPWLPIRSLQRCSMRERNCDRGRVRGDPGPGGYPALIAGKAPVPLDAEARRTGEADPPGL